MTTDNNITLTWINPNGDDLTGYRFADFFDCDIETATAAELTAAYKCADCDGIEVAINGVRVEQNDDMEGYTHVAYGFLTDIKTLFRAIPVEFHTQGAEGVYFTLRTR
jgi:hypothetical protein